VNELAKDYEVKLNFPKQSFIMDFAFSERHQVVGLVASDSRIFFYQT
jgi:hypothetical protein